MSLGEDIARRVLRLGSRGHDYNVVTCPQPTWTNNGLLGGAGRGGGG